MSGTTNVPSCYLILKKDNKALFLMRQNTGYMDGFYGLPSGHVEDGENFSDATVRETLEEVNVKTNPKKLSHVHTMHRKSNEDNDVRVDVFFQTEEWQGEPKNMEPHKHSEMTWLDLDDLPENIMDYVLLALERAKQGQIYSEHGWD